MVGRVKSGKAKWRIVAVYIERNGMEGALQKIEKWIRIKEESIRTIVGGDFNARTGREGEGFEVGVEGNRKGRERKRNSKNE